MNSSREAFDKWAGEIGITEPSAWLAWQAGIKHILSRPTTNTRMDTAEFKKDNPETLVDRLRGIYPVPVLGQYKTEPILHEAAREIERLRKDEADLIHDNSNLYASLQGEMNARLVAEKEIERLRESVGVLRELRDSLFQAAVIWDGSKGVEGIAEYNLDYPSGTILYVINKKPAEAG